MKTFRLIIIGIFFSNLGFSQYVITVFDKHTGTKINNYDLYFVNEQDTIIPDYINDSTLNILKSPKGYSLQIKHDSTICKLLNSEWYNNVRIGLNISAKPTCVQGYTKYLDGNKISYSQDFDNKYGECRDNSHFVCFIETMELKKQLQFDKYFIDPTGYSCYNIFKSINDTLSIKNKDKFKTITISVACVLDGKIIQIELFDSRSKLGYEVIQEYSKTNKLTEFKMQTFDGSSLGRFEKIYNKNDKLIETKFYDRNGGYSGSTKISYNDQNIKISQKFSVHDGNFVERKEFKYNSNDSLESELTYNSDSLVSKTEFVYGADNKLVKHNTFLNDKLEQSVIVKYSLSGLKYEELTFNNKNILIERTKYDQNGFDIESIKYNNDGTEKEYRYNYILRN